jgi:hypothetical protein
MNRHILDLYTDFLICSPHYRTATGLSDLMEGAVSHDKITRFLSAGVYGSRELWLEVKGTVRKVESEDGVLILDDTIEEKPYTDENSIVCWHYDHSKGRSIKGINLISAVVRYEEVSIPVGFEVVVKDEEFLDPESGKKKRRARRNKNEIFRDLLQVCEGNVLKYKYVLADSWYSSKENMEFVRQKKKHFIFAIKSNRTLALSQEEKRRGQFQKIESLQLEKGQAVQVYLKGLDFPVLLVKQIFTNEDGSIGILYLVSSDLSLSGERIIEIYKKRWKIEEYHKSIKSNLGLEKSPTRKEQTQMNHIFAALCAYAKLESLSVKQHMNHYALKYKLIVKATQRAMLELQHLYAQNYTLCVT